MDLATSGTGAGRRLRGAVNWLNLSTPAGLALARVGASSTRRGRDDLWLAFGYRLPVPPAPAFTVGSVVLFRRADPGVTDPSATISSRLLAHEGRHATQYAYCGGLLMIPAYLVAAAWSWIRTGDAGSRNIFERAAGLSDGGYRERPVRPVLEAIAHARRVIAGSGVLDRLVARVVARPGDTRHR